ncbi:reverse transcriptase domain-containing protein, partial [Tanacetum coccineum]
TLTPFGDSDFLLEEVDAFLALEDDPTSPDGDHSYYDSEGGILLLEAFLNDDPSLPPPTQGMYFPEIQKELQICEAKNDKSSIDEPPEVKLKDLPPHLEYAFLEGDDKFPIIIAKDFSVEEKAALIIVLKSHKRAIAWKLSDIKGISPEFCTHKILMEEDYKPTVQHQRRVNPKIHDVIKKEVEKLLDAGLIYPISDSPWVSPVHCVPKKGGFTVVENDENELIPTRLVTGWRICIDYRKLNEATHKDHFPLPFMDQMLKRLAGNEYYCFLDGFSGYFQIPIDPHDQEKTTFTCPYGTFAYRRMPFGLCNAPGTFQRCIVLGHKISKNGIEVDKSKIDVIAKLPHPTTVKGAKKLLTSSKLAIVDPPRDITVPTTPPKRFLTQNFIGPLFTEMPMTWSLDVILVNVKEKFRNEMKCHKIPSKFAKSLTCGASISWGHSRLHEGTSTHSWRSITWLNGLKQKSSPPTMPDLFANYLNLSSPDSVPLVLSLVIAAPIFAMTSLQ